MLRFTELSQIALEGHTECATLYVIGFLAEETGARLEDIIRDLPAATRVIRLDLRPVQIIDPRAFVRVARALSDWRDRTRGRVLIEFPERSKQRRAPLSLVTQRASTTAAVNSAMSCPAITSPG